MQVPWGVKPAAYSAPTKLPILVPATMSTGIPFSSRDMRTPICASPRAPPALSASPTVGCGLSLATSCLKQRKVSRKVERMPDRSKATLPTVRRTCLHNKYSTFSMDCQQVFRARKDHRGRSGDLPLCRARAKLIFQERVLGIRGTTCRRAPWGPAFPYGARAVPSPLDGHTSGTPPWQPSARQ